VSTETSSSDSYPVTRVFEIRLASASLQAPKILEKVLEEIKFQKKKQMCQMLQQGK
jgi:hypothetical protein